MRCPASNSRRRVMSMLADFNLSGADYTLSDFQSRSALQKFTLRVLVVMRAITQRGVACGEVADGLCELGARCSDASGIVLRAFMRCTRQSCVSQFSAQLEPCGLHPVRLASVQVAQHEQRKQCYHQPQAARHVERHFLPGDGFHAEACQESELAFGVVAQYPLIPLVGERVQIKAQVAHPLWRIAFNERQGGVVRQGGRQTALYAVRGNGTGRVDAYPCLLY